MLDIVSSLLDNNSSIMLTFLVGTIVPFLLCWTLLNKFPTFLHRKRSLGNKGLCNIIAHRGSREEGLPENTLSAFKDAIAAGTNVIELDVWLTKDNEVVIHHDETFTRMTKGQCTAKITEMNYDQLPLICPPHGQNARCDDTTGGIDVVVSTGTLQRYCVADWSRIPKLKDVLNLIPSSSKVAVIVEVKQDSDLLIDKVHRLLIEQQHFDYRESCYWFSLTESINKKLRDKDKDIATITSIQGMLRVLGLHYLGLLPFCSIDDSVFGVTVEEITLQTVLKEKAIAGFPLWAKHALAKVFAGRPPGPMMAPSLFSHLRARGIPVWFLGVNNEDDLHLAVKAGDLTPKTLIRMLTIDYFKSRCQPKATSLY